MSKNINVEELASSLTKTMEINLSKVQEVLDLDINDLIDIIERLLIEDKDKVVSIIINNQLQKLKTTLTIKKYKEIIRDVDEITDYYASKKEDFDVVIEEGDNVSNDILLKVIGNNDRKVELPVDINIIKNYCFSTELKEEQFYDTLMWIALRYIAISRCLILKENEEANQK